MRLCVCLCLHGYMYVCVFVFVVVCIYVYMYMCVCICGCMYNNYMFVCSCACVLYICDIRGGPLSWWCGPLSLCRSHSETECGGTSTCDCRRWSNQFPRRGDQPGLSAPQTGCFSIDVCECEWEREWECEGVYLLLCRDFLFLTCISFPVHSTLFAAVIWATRIPA
jgi:hypothetical protein